MCLIIVGKAEKVRSTLLNTQGLLEDIFRSNPDGIGIMYANARRGLRIFKSLPKNVAQARHFLTRMPGDERNLAIHFRWTTHGFTNKENCHPYTVVEGECALMHNGVLHTGNSADRSKSDTWHFINDFLKTAVQMAPAIVHDVGFKTLVKDFIRSTNRFVIMTRDGTCSIINAKEGIEHDELWFSNTYAWSPGLLIESYKGRYNGYQGGSFRGGRYGGSYGYGGVDYEGGYGYAPSYSGGSSGGSQSGGTQSGGTKSGHTAGAQYGGVTHNAGVTSANRFAHRGQTVSEDEQEEAAWRSIVNRTQRGWPNTGSNGASTVAPAAGAAANAGAGDRGGQDAPEEGQEGQEGRQGAAASSQWEHRPPLNDDLTTALLNADVDAFTGWLEHFPSTTLYLLFNNWMAEPTKWCQQKDLDGYSSFLYEACMNADRELLKRECEDAHASFASVAEVICYYLNWVEIDAKAVAARNPQYANGTKVADTADGPYSPFPKAPPEEGGSNDLPHEVAAAVSEAQMGQGGDSDGDGFAFMSV